MEGREAWKDLVGVEGGKASVRVYHTIEEQRKRKEKIKYFLIPSLGKKYISAIKPVQILNVADEAAEDKPLVEGILKNIFSYATECGYVTFDPCKDLNFEGSIEEEEKQSKTFKSRLAGMGKKIGMSMLNKYIDKNSGNEK